jgi:hypothetical protein
VLFANKTIIYKLISFIPFYIIYSKKAMLLVKTCYFI